MSDKNPSPSLDKRRAAYAWKLVQGCSVAYINLAKGAPALIMNNGLMQTLAYYQGKKEAELLNTHILNWLAIYFTKQDNANIKFETMMECLIQADSKKYRKATEETLSLLRWIRQFASISGK